ncbi:MAG TPA: CmcJ/NvfI family oxidoreductase [Rhizomicrobium sp.]
MAVAVAEKGEADNVRATLNYIVNTGVKPVAETYGRDGLERRNTSTFAPQSVLIHEGRPLRDTFTLDGSGFELIDHQTAMKTFYDPEELRAVYYPEVERLIAARSGAARVHIFDHTIRTSDESARLVQKLREPVLAVHNDYTEWSGPQRVRDLFPGEAETILTKRFAIIQVWRAINKPVARDPLAIADARSLAPTDFVPAERRFPDRVGEIYQFAYNPVHRWYYFPRMHREEALVFKVYDSAKDGRARWSAHSAFTDPTSRPDAPPRESIEIRAFAFFAS